MAYLNLMTFEIKSDVSEQDKSIYCELDDGIAEAILVINRKGYRTAFCCSGHADSGHNPEIAYIQFEFGGITPEYLPDGWQWICDGQMEYVYSETEEVYLKREIETVMDKLLSWASDLPYV